MSVALYLVTHEGIASQLLATAHAIIGQATDNMAYLEIPMDADSEEYSQQAINCIKDMDSHDGLILVTDIFGATPSNIAQTLATHFEATLISGLNLPMLLRLLNYRHEPLLMLTNRAIEGGRNGIQQH